MARMKRELTEPEPVRQEINLVVYRCIIRECGMHEPCTIIEHVEYGDFFDPPDRCPRARTEPGQIWRKIGEGHEEKL